MIFKEFKILKRNHHFVQFIFLSSAVKRKSESFETACIHNERARELAKIVAENERRKEGKRQKGAL